MTRISLSGPSACTEYSLHTWGRCARWGGVQSRSWDSLLGAPAAAFRDLDPVDVPALEADFLAKLRPLVRCAMSLPLGHHNLLFFSASTSI